MPDAFPEPEWRRLGPRLWVGRLDGAPLGMVERGRHYTAIDASERVRGTFRTLDEAQAALAPAPRPPDGREQTAGREPRGRLMFIGTSTAGVIAAVMAAVGLRAFV